MKSKKMRVHPDFYSMVKTQQQTMKKTASYITKQYEKQLKRKSF